MLAWMAIPLTQGLYALIDDEDYEWLNQWKWSASKEGINYYAVRSQLQSDGKARRIRMHREILGLKYGDKKEGDHRNHCGLDNRRNNLRTLTRQGNQWNQRVRRGYCFHVGTGKWRARINYKGKQISLGLFATETEAHNAYLKAKKIYHQIAKI